MNHTRYVGRMVLNSRRAYARSFSVVIIQVSADCIRPEFLEWGMEYLWYNRVRKSWRKQSAGNIVAKNIRFHGDET